MNGETILETLRTLYREGDVFEVRILNAGKHGTVSGYFDDHQKTVEAVSHWDGNVAAIYLTLNPVMRDLLSRAKNRLKANVKSVTQDFEIQRRRWVFMDADPIRASGISSSEEEHEASLNWIRQVAEELMKEGWPKPVLADSGNGGHALFPIDMGADDITGHKIKALLESLANRFNYSDDIIPQVKLDTGVFNASRLTKLYGTLVQKGDNTAERPHRRSSIIRYEEEVAL